MLKHAFAGVVVVALSAAGGRAEEPAEVKAVIDKAVAAVGGPEKAAKLHAVTKKARGHANADDAKVDLSYDIELQGTDLGRMDLEVTINGNPVKGLVVLNGDKIWVRGPDGTVNEQQATQVAVAKDYIFVIRLAENPLLLRDARWTVAHGGEGKVGDKATVVLRVSRKGRPDVNLYYDKQTSLPLRAETRLPDSNGIEAEHEWLFAEYKDFDGIKHCGKVTFRRDGKTLLETEFSDFKAVGKLADDRFAKP
jgi:hypothetical protein